jgi:hypothetical protein
MKRLEKGVGMGKIKRIDTRILIFGFRGIWNPKYQFLSKGSLLCL